MLTRDVVQAALRTRHKELLEQRMLKPIILSASPTCTVVGLKHDTSSNGKVHWFGFASEFPQDAPPEVIETILAADFHAYFCNPLRQLAVTKKSREGTSVMRSRYSLLSLLGLQVDSAWGGSDELLLVGVDGCIRQIKWIHPTYHTPFRCNFAWHPREESPLTVARIKWLHMDSKHEILVTTRGTQRFVICTVTRFKTTQCEISELPSDGIQQL